MKVRFFFIVLWTAAFLVFSAHSQKQRQWQRMKKLNSIIVGDPNRLTDEHYWLSTDPNHFCADLNFDKHINFYDYARYLKMKEM